MKLGEPDARILALRIAATYPGRTATTAQIKRDVPRYVKLTDADLTPSDTRANEEKWQQIVGNVISHKGTSTSIFNRGFAVRTADGIRVTDEGVAYVKKLGYSV